MKLIDVESGPVACWRVRLPGPGVAGGPFSVLALGKPRSASRGGGSAPGNLFAEGSLWDTQKDFDASRSGVLALHRETKTARVSRSAGLESVFEVNVMKGEGEFLAFGCSSQEVIDKDALGGVVVVSLVFYVPAGGGEAFEVFEKGGLGVIFFLEVTVGDASSDGFTIEGEHSCKG